MYPALYCVVKAQRHAPFSGRHGALGSGWHKLHTPKIKLTKSVTTDLFNIFFFVSPARLGHGNSASYFLGQMVFSIRKFPWFRKARWMPRMPRITQGYVGVILATRYVYPPNRKRQSCQHGVNRNGSCVLFLGDGNSRMDPFFFSFRNNWVRVLTIFLFSTRKLGKCSNLTNILK